MLNLSNYDPRQLESWEHTLLHTAAAISLSQAQYQKISDRYETLEGILNTPDEPVLAGAHIFSQGSIALKTTISPVANAPGDMGTVDADAIVLLPNARGASATDVLAAMKRRVSAGCRVTTPIKELRRGVRVIYADENPGFHIDITPAVGLSGRSDYEGKGNLIVPDRVTGWKNSSPRSYADWLQWVSDQVIELRPEAARAALEHVMVKASIEPIPEYERYLEHNPLRATIKLLKRHRDVWAIKNDRADYRPISAVITTLAGKAYLEVARKSKQKPYRPVEAILEIVASMRAHIRINSQGEFEVLNPKDEGENFAEKWNRDDGCDYVQAFEDWHGKVIEDLMMGLKDLGSQQAFQNSFTSAFGLPEAMIEQILRRLPDSAPLPGRGPAITRNSASVAMFLGGTGASTNSQSHMNTGRLG